MSKLILVISLIIFPVFTSMAAEVFLPVQDITLTYDLKSGNLHVQASHASQNWSIDYVRMMTVAVNGQIVSTSNYYRQKSGDGFSDDVQVHAQVGDVIMVELFTTGAGDKAQDLTVVAPETT